MHGCLIPYQLGYTLFLYYKQSKNLFIDTNIYTLFPTIFLWWATNYNVGLLFRYRIVPTRRLYYTFSLYFTVDSFLFYFVLKVSRKLCM